MMHIFVWITQTFYPVAGSLALLAGPVPSGGLVLLLLFVDAIKRLTRELRPDGTDHRSFPSGHAATAWYLAATSHYHLLVVVWALLASASRVFLRRHYLHDVLVGAFLGIAAGWGLARIVPSRRRFGWKKLLTSRPYLV
jgi:membrane-associated phospholipid phosphatase